MGNSPVAPETTALGHPGSVQAQDSRTCDEPIPSTQSASAPPPPSAEKGSFRSGPQAPRARPAPVPTSILDVRHHLEQLLIAPSRTPYPRKEAGK